MRSCRRRRGRWGDGEMGRWGDEETIRLRDEETKGLIY